MDKCSKCDAALRLREVAICKSCRQTAVERRPDIQVDVEAAAPPRKRRVAAKKKR